MTQSDNSYSRGPGDVSLGEPGDASRLAVVARDASAVDRRCGWCGGVVSSSRRRDAKFCGVRCRQASHRFGISATEAVASGRPMRFAYADPPYPGKAGYYPERQEVDHASLLEQLTAEFPNGWALSTSAAALRDVLASCPPGVRVAAWVRPVRRTGSRRALSAWEPVVLAGGRPLPVVDGQGRRVVQDLHDALVYRGRYRAFPGALVGMKPPQFSEWVFKLLGATRSDELVDLFPGSGAVAEAWLRYVGGIAETRPPASADASPLQGLRMTG
jgi:hypothetical protein